MGNLVEISCGEKDPLGRIALRGKNVPLAREVTERFTTGKWNVKKEKLMFYINLTSLRFCILHAVVMMIPVKTKCKKHRDHDLTESSKSPASIAKSNKQLFGYEQVAKRIANIRLTQKKS